MTLPELLQYFTTSDTIGENKDVVEMMIKQLDNMERQK